MLTIIHRWSATVTAFLIPVLFFDPILRAENLTPRVMFDANADGLPDIWQDHYGAFSLSPTSDLDGDGFTNAAEAIAGTNPYAYSSRPTLDLIQQPNGQGMLSWPTVAHKRYQIKFSTDLQTWQDWGSPFVGTGADYAIQTGEKSGTSGYFRLGVIDAADADEDGLTDWEEMIAQTDHALVDTDQDGVSDADEIHSSTNPLLASSRPAKFSIISGQWQSLASRPRPQETTLWETTEALCVKLVGADGAPWANQSLRFTILNPPNPSPSLSDFGISEGNIRDLSSVGSMGSASFVTVTTDDRGMASTVFRKNYVGAVSIVVSKEGGGVIPTTFQLFTGREPLQKPSFVTGFSETDVLILEKPTFVAISARSEDLAPLTPTSSPGTIRYSTDGTPPTLSSPIYEGPILASSTGFIQAAVEREGVWSEIRALEIRPCTTRIRSGLTQLCYGGGNVLSTPAPAPLGRDTTGTGIIHLVTNPTTPISDFSIGFQHGLIVLADGTLRSWGAESYGELGNGNTSTESVGATPVSIAPTSTTESPFFIQVASGEYHSLALDTEGKVWGWGRATQNGHTSNRTSPTMVGGLPRILHLSAGKDFSAAVGVDGNVYCWGNLPRIVADANVHPKTGIIYTLRKDPTANSEVQLAAKFVRVSAGNGHLLASDATGDQWVLGMNDSGQCGREQTGTPKVNYLSPATVFSSPKAVRAEAIGDRTWLINGNGLSVYGKNPGINGWPTAMWKGARLKNFTSRDESNQTVCGWGGSSESLVWSDRFGNIRSIGNQTQIVAGSNERSYARPDTGTYDVTNAPLPWNQVDAPGFNDRVVTSSRDSFVIFQNGRTLVFGENSKGQLGIGNQTDSFNAPQELSHPTLNRVFTQAAPGSSHTLLLDSTHTVFSCGESAFFQLGNASGGANVLAPQTASVFNQPAVSRKAKLIGVGDDFSIVATGSRGDAAGVSNLGQCRTTSSTVSSNTFTFTVPAAGGGTTTVPCLGLAVGSGHVLVHLDTSATGWLNAWGNNDVGQISPLLATTSSAVPIITDDWADALEFAGQFNPRAGRRCNFNFSGRLKYTPDAGSPTPSLSLDGTWAFGGRQYSLPESSSTFSPLAGKGALLAEATPLRGYPGSTIRDLSVGYYHQLILDYDGNIWAWGDNRFGQLGQGDNRAYTSFVRVSGLPPIKAVAAGLEQSLAMDHQGNVYHWGPIFKPRLLLAGPLVSPNPPVNDDLDSDTLSDAWELSQFNNLAQNAGSDWDGDGLSNGKEFIEGSQANSITRHRENGNILAGSTEASSRVNPDGSLGISIPLKIAQGFPGAPPSLALEYSSHAQDGNCGWGWNLAGISRITRGGAHPKRDGFTDPIDFDNNDTFHLDGQRLVIVSGTHNTDGASYRTESDVFSRVTLIKTTPESTVAGPDAFTVETKSGLLMRFEPPTYVNPWGESRGGPPANFNPNGKTAHVVWLLKSVIDRSGNETLYDYTTIAGELQDNPNEIVVTAPPTNQLEPGVTTSRTQLATALPADYVLSGISFGINRQASGQNARCGKVNFHYKVADRPTIKFISDRAIQNAFLLSEVECGVADYFFLDGELSFTAFDVNRRYRTVYENSSENGRALLSRVTESFADGTELNPLVFTYGNPVKRPAGRDVSSNIWPYEPTSGQIPVPISDASDGPVGARFVDVNGDGLIDILKTGTGSTWTAETWINSTGDPGQSWTSSAQFLVPVQLWKSPATDLEKRQLGAIQFVDCNADRLPDLVQPLPSQINIYRNTGTGWSLWRNIPWNLTNDQFDPRGLLIADTNGDQAPEFLYHYKHSAGTVQKGYISSKVSGDFTWSSNSAAAPPSIMAKWDDASFKPHLITDWNGDGFVDWMSVTEAAYPSTAQPVWQLRKGAGNGGWVDNSTEWVNPLRFSPKFGAAVLDLNGDTLPDIVYASTNATVGRRAYLNTGIGFRYEPAWNIPSTITPQLDSTGASVATAESIGFTDVNGDGLVDIYHATKWASSSGEGVYLNTGKGFLKKSGVSLVANLDEPGVQLVDVDGDGADDLINGVSREIFLNRASKHEVMTQMQDGFGTTISWTHVDRGSVALEDDLDPPIYEMANDQVAGLKNERSPYHLVSEMVLSDVTAEGFDKTVTYRYGGGRSHTEVHGWLGFEWFEEKDLSTSIATRTDFLQQYPYIGQPKTVTQLAGDQIISQQEITWDRAGNIHAEPLTWGLGLIITEINYNPENDPDQRFEFIELMNTADRPLSLKGVRFTAGVVYGFPDDALLAPGERLIVAKDISASGFISRYPTSEYPFTAGKVYGPFSGDLSNTGETITLVARGLVDIDPAPVEQDELLTSVTYGVGGVWPASPNGGGKTLIYNHLNPSGGQDDPINWQPHGQENGNPGAEDGVYIPLVDFFASNSAAFQIYSVYPRITVESRYDLAFGTPIFTKTTRSTVNSWGDVIQLSVNYDDGRSEIVQNSYSNDATTWTLGKLAGATTVSTTNGQSKRRSITYAQDSASRLQSTTIEPTATYAMRTSCHRNEFGRETMATQTAPDISPRKTLTQYDGDGRFALLKCNPMGHTVRTNYIPALGVPAWTEDANGLRTSYVYDGMGRVLEERRPDGNVLRKAYLTPGPNAPEGCKTQVVEQIEGVDLAIVYLDGLGREIRKDSTLPNGLKSSVVTTYDNAGRLKTQSHPFRQDATSYFNASSTYDAMSRPTTVVAADGGSSTYTYHGLWVSEENALGQTRETTVDSQGRTTRVMDNLGRTIVNTYDAKGNLTETNAHGVITRRFYDDRGKLIRLEDPSRGTLLFVYNSVGELVRETDARGNVTFYQYDANGRQVFRHRPEGGVRTEYDLASGAGIGKPHRVIADNGNSETYHYDSLGRIIWKEKKIFNPHRNEFSTFNFHFDYDDVGRLRKVTYPNGTRAEYTYASTATPVGMTGWSAQDIQVASYSALAFDAYGNPSTELLGNQTLHRTYDGQTGRLTNASLLNGAEQQTYVWNKLGNLVSRQDAFANATETITYDSLNRITGSARNGVANLAVTYAPNGNILTKTGSGTYTYGNSFQPYAVSSITGPTFQTLLYDASGNVTHGLGAAVTYNSLQKPSLIQDTAAGLEQRFSYGVSDEIAVQFELNLSGTRTTLYGDNLFELVYEDDDPNTPQTFNRLTEQVSFVVAGRTIAAQATIHSGTSSTQETQYCHYDHLGSLILLFTSAGTVLSRFSYDAFGQRRLQDWQAGTPSPETPGTYRFVSRGFTGHVATQRSSFIHMGGRLYHAALGRFFSADPIISDVNSLQDYNAYSYVSNNPLSVTDPTGYFSLKKAFGGVGKFFGGIGKWFGGIGKLFGGLFRSFGDWVADAAKKVGKWIERNWRTLVVIVVAVVLTILIGWTGIGNVATAIIVGAIAGALTPALQGRPIGEILKGAIIGAVLGAATAGIGSGLGSAANFFNGSVAQGIGMTLAKSALHGVVGGIRSVIDGGSFWTGFATAAVAAGATVGITHIDNMALETAATSVVGGITSELAGGDFGDGAAIAAYSYLFNESLSEAAEEVNDEITEKAHETVRNDTSNSADEKKMITVAIDYVKTRVQAGWTATKDFTNRMWETLTTFGGNHVGDELSKPEP